MSEPPRSYFDDTPALYDRVEPNVELGYSGDDPKKGMEIRAKTDIAKTRLDIEAAIDAVTVCAVFPPVMAALLRDALSGTANCWLPPVIPAAG